MKRPEGEEVEDTGFKLWYTGATPGRNGVGILIDRSLKDCEENSGGRDRGGFEEDEGR